MPVLNNVRYASDSDHSRYESELTLWAITGRTALQQIDCDLLVNVLTYLRQKLSWAVGLWHVIVAACRLRLLFFAAKRI